MPRLQLAGDLGLRILPQVDVDRRPRETGATAPMHQHEVEVVALLHVAYRRPRGDDRRDRGIAFGLPHGVDRPCARALARPHPDGGQRLVQGLRRGECSGGRQLLCHRASKCLTQSTRSPSATAHSYCTATTKRPSSGRPLWAPTRDAPTAERAPAPRDHPSPARQRAVPAPTPTSPYPPSNTTDRRERPHDRPHPHRHRHRPPPRPPRRPRRRAHAQPAPRPATPSRAP